MQTATSLRLGALFSSLLFAASSGAQTRVIDAAPENYRARLSQLEPGDVMRLAPGDYLDGLPIHRLNGRPEARIRIAGRDARNRPRFVARRGNNTVSIVDSSYVEIAGLDLEGRGMPVDAVKAEGHARFAHHITVEDLSIHGHGAGQQIVGISTKCPAWDWIIRNNIIVSAGTGIYLGDSDGSAPFVGGLIEGNLIRDTRGYNLQIKHQRTRSDVPGMPSGPSVTVIRRNVFSKAQNAAAGELARPNVLVGHFPKEGAGVDDAYLIYANFFYDNATEALFQGEGNFAFYSNALVNRSGNALNIQPHHGRPESVDVFANTVLARDTGISIVGGNPERQQRVFGNLVFADVPIVGGQVIGNVVGSQKDAARWLVNPFAPLGKLNLAPREVNETRVPDWPELPRGAPDASLDFDGAPRTAGIAGAYATGTVNWRLALTRKPLPK